MSTMLDWNLWRLSFSTIALGATAAFLAVLMAQRWVQSMTWRRTLWQIAFLSVGLLALAELSGTSRLALNWVREPAAVPDQTTTLIEVKVIDELDPQLLASALAKKAQRASNEPANALAGPRSLQWPTALWLGGIGAVLTWIIILRLCFWLLVRRRLVRDEALLARVDAIARRLGLSRQVRVTEVRRLAGPIAHGILLPGISLPEGFTHGHSIEQQDVMLAHELAHLAARDPLWHTLADIVISLVWWHPLAWLAQHELHAAADEACLVVENGPATLAECLVELGGRLSHRRSLGWLGMAGGGFRSGLGKRVRRLLATGSQTWNPPAPHRVSLTRLVAPLAIAALILATTVLAQPAAIGPTTLRDAFQQSVLGIMLTTALPTPQKATPATRESEVIGKTPAVTATPPRRIQTNWINNQPISAQQVATQLYTRFFRIDRDLFERALVSAAKTDRDQAISDAIKIPLPATISTGKVVMTGPAGSELLVTDARRYFIMLGVDFSDAGKQLAFNERTGALMIRATLPDLDIIEQAIQVLNTPPPQVTIEASVFEITTEDARALGLDRFLGSEFTNLLKAASTQTTNFHVTGILTDPQRRVILKAMDQSGLTNLLNTPNMTMLSGRPGQFKHVRVRYIVTDLDWSNTITSLTNPPQAQPIAEPFELGPVLDVVPYVQADGKTIELTTIPTVTEFLGYDLDNRERREVVTMPDGRKQIVVVPDQPLPIFRKRQIVTSATVKDGHTLVLAGGSDQLLVNHTSKTALFHGKKPPSKTSPSHLLIFVTPTLIDPAGNRINPSE